MHHSSSVLIKNDSIYLHQSPRASLTLNFIWVYTSHLSRYNTLGNLHYFIDKFPLVQIIVPQLYDSSHFHLGMFSPHQLSKDTTKADLADYADNLRTAADATSDPAKVRSSEFHSCIHCLLYFKMSFGCQAIKHVFDYSFLLLPIIQQDLHGAADDLDAINNGIYAIVKGNQDQLYSDVIALQKATSSIPVSLRIVFIILYHEWFFINGPPLCSLQDTVDGVLNATKKTEQYLQTQGSNITKEVGDTSTIIITSNVILTCTAYSYWVHISHFDRRLSTLPTDSWK